MNSNVTETGELHFDKQHTPSTSTDDGITRSSSSLRQKVASSMNTNFDRDSNATAISDLQWKKQDWSIISSGDGRTISWNPLRQNGYCSGVSPNHERLDI
jgi:hypothetical protein